MTTLLFKIFEAHLSSYVNGEHSLIATSMLFRLPVVDNRPYALPGIVYNSQDVRGQALKFTYLVRGKMSRLADRFASADHLQRHLEE